MDLGRLASGGKAVLQSAAKSLEPCKAEVLMVLGFAGFGTTIFLVHNAAVRGDEIVRHIREVKNSRTVTEDKKRLLKSDVQRLIKLYSPAVIAGGISAACFIASNRVQAKRIAVLTSAYAISESTLRKYQQNVLEELGEETHHQIMDRMATDEAPFEQDYEYRIESDGSTLCYDRVTGRYFKSSTEAIRAAESTVIKRCVDETRVSLNDFYTELGLEDNSFIGDAVGWDISKIRPDIYFTSMLSKEGEPALVLNYNVCVIDNRIFGTSNLAYY